jgi:hypothetical protein
LTIRWIAIGIEKINLLSCLVNIKDAPVAIRCPRIEKEDDVNAINKFFRYIVIEDNCEWFVSDYWQNIFISAPVKATSFNFPPLKESNDGNAILFFSK